METAMSSSSTAAPPAPSSIKEKQTEPDSDTIKMFVGQIPRTFSEADCIKIFEEYGSIYQLNIHRDKISGESKGCCFVTYFHRQDAIKAQDALHNTKVLPGMHNAMQVKPADLENRNERKLFIGMLSRTADENDVRKLFDSFGSIEEVTVLRDAGKSRGCAFVTFVNRSCANTAIRQMHHSMTFEGCSKPIVVKLADSNSKDARKGTSDSASPMPLLQQLVQNALPVTGNVTNQLTSLGALLQNPSVATLLGSVIAGLANNANNSQDQQSKQNTSGSGSGSTLNRATSASAASGGASSSNGEGSGPLMAQQQHLQALQQQQQYLELLKQQQQAQQAFTVDPATGQIILTPQQQHFPSPLGGFLPPVTIAPNYATLVDYQQKTSPNPFLDPTALIPRTIPGAIPTPIVDPTSGMLLNGTATSTAIPCYGQQFVPNGITSPVNNNTINAPAGINTSKGPDGCNLFIYHLPQEFTDDDLKSLFSHFGSVISAKVFIDKQTNLSKCFGFVSFDSASNAQSAIRGMNGFSIGSKRLKVQLKRSGDKPYARGDAASPTNSDVHY